MDTEDKILEEIRVQLSEICEDLRNNLTAKYPDYKAFIQSDSFHRTGEVRILSISKI